MKELKRSIENIVKSGLVLFLLNTGCGDDENLTGTNTRATLIITPDPIRITQTGSNYQTEQLLFEFRGGGFTPYYGSWEPKYTAIFHTLEGTRIGETTDFIDPFTHYSYQPYSDFYGRLNIPSTVVDVVRGEEQNSFHADVSIYNMHGSTYTLETTETDRITLNIE